MNKVISSWKVNWNVYGASGSGGESDTQHLYRCSNQTCLCLISHFLCAQWQTLIEALASDSEADWSVKLAHGSNLESLIQGCDDTVLVAKAQSPLFLCLDGSDQSSLQDPHHSGGNKATAAAIQRDWPAKMGFTLVLSHAANTENMNFFHKVSCLKICLKCTFKLLISDVSLIQQIILV